jgi:hypothetical protein
MESHVTDMGDMVCARHRIPAGFDSTPLYRGLPHDMCPCEHWCYLAAGKLRYRFELTPADAHRRKAEHLAQHAAE